ncbi:MAG TPA: hypothetical protein VN249_02195, partial [Prolixibacteraceae bacterium]|nr:hypothetical protein [Prolixibacteraceae bacterium]
MMHVKKNLKILVPFLLFPLFSFGQIKDEPFLQATSVKYEMAPELKNAKILKVEADYNNNVYVLTDKGLYRDFYESKISKDLLYRKLSDLNPLDITTQEGSGYLYCLYADRFLTNAHAGTIFAKIPVNDYQVIRVNSEGIVLLAGKDKVTLYKNSDRLTDLKLPAGLPLKWYVHGAHFYVLSGNAIKKLENNEWKTIFSSEKMTSLAFSANNLVVGTE